MAEKVMGRSGRVVGVLGGMGPYATVEFMRHVLDLTPAQKDWDHVHMVVDNNTQIPSRSRALLYDEESPLEGMVAACHKLAQYPVDVIALPCNSACHWHHELQKRVKTPVLDIVAIACEALIAKYPSPEVRDQSRGAIVADREARDAGMSGTFRGSATKRGAARAREGGSELRGRGTKTALGRVTALGGMVLYLTDLYRRPLERRRQVYVRLDEPDQDRVVAMIEAVKLAGSVDAELRQAFAELVQELTARYELDGAVLACTEFSFFKDDALAIEVVDSSFSLAQFVVDYAHHGRPLPLDVDQVRRFWDERAAMIEREEAGVLQATMLTSSEGEASAREASEKATLLGHLEPILEADDRLLELGCGTGRWSRTLAGRVGHVDAYDYSDRFIELARRLSANAGIDNVAYHCCDIEDVPGDESYDVVISVALLHYLDEAQFRAVLAIVRRAVKEGGHAVFRETFGVDKRFELHGFYSAVLDTTYHAVYRTTDELAAGLPGFELVIDAVTLPPVSEKPETCQKVAVFRRVSAVSENGPESV